MKYDLIIFDLDGTLIDSLGDLTESLNYALRQADLDTVDDEDTREWIGKGLARFLMQALGDDYSDELFESIKAQFLEHYGSNFSQHTCCYDGIIDMLDALGGGQNMAIFSNKHTRFILPILQHFNIDTLFPHYLGGDNPDGHKPCEKGVFTLMSRYNASPDRTIIVGDMPVDIRTAQNAGIQSCAVLWGYGSANELHEMNPDYVAASPAELVPVLTNNLNTSAS